MTDQTNRPALEACPFCGNDGTGSIEEALHVSHEELEHHPWYNVYSVQCDKCCASQGYSETEDEAITAWNTRHQPAQAGGNPAAT